MGPWAAASRGAQCWAVEGKLERPFEADWLRLAFKQQSFFQSQPFDPWRHKRSHLHLCFVQVVQWGRVRERKGEGSRHLGNAERGHTWPLKP